MNGERSEPIGTQHDILSEIRPKYLSPMRLFAIIATTVFLGEVLVMLTLAMLPETPMVVEALTDGLMITLFVTPALVLFLIRPMVAHINHREVAEEKLRKLNDALEDRVAERTKELTAANEHLKREISERKIAEGGLSKSADFIGTVLGSAPCIFAIYDFNSLACSFVNDSVTSLLGYSPEEVLVKGREFFEEIFSPGDFSRFRDLNARMAAGIEGEILKCECDLRDAKNEVQRFGIGIVVMMSAPGKQLKDALLAAVPTQEGWPAVQNGLGDS